MVKKKKRVYNHSRKKKKTINKYGFLVAAILIIAGVYLVYSNTVHKGGPVTTYESVFQELQSYGYEVKQTGLIEQPFVPIEGQILNVGNDAVQVFEFGSETDAQHFANTVSKDATEIDNTAVTWIDDPHFYLSGNTVALYVGNSNWIQDALTKSMGKQFAGTVAKEFCTTESREAEFCIEIYNPVCGWFDPVKVQCVTYPCGQTFSNSCFTCQNSDVLYYTEGECPE